MRFFCALKLSGKSGKGIMSYELGMAIWIRYKRIDINPSSIKVSRHKYRDQDTRQKSEDVRIEILDLRCKLFHY